MIVVHYSCYWNPSMMRISSAGDYIFIYVSIIRSFSLFVRNHILFMTTSFSSLDTIFSTLNFSRNYSLHLLLNSLILWCRLLFRQFFFLGYSQPRPAEEFISNSSPTNYLHIVLGSIFTFSFADDLFSFRQVPTKTEYSSWITAITILIPAF